MATRKQIPAQRRVDGVQLPELTEAIVPPDLRKHTVEQAVVEVRGMFSRFGIGEKVELKPQARRLAYYDIAPSPNGVGLYAEGKAVGNEISGAYAEAAPLVQYTQDLAQILRTSGVPQAARQGDVLLQELISAFANASTRQGPSVRTVRELTEGLGFRTRAIARDGCSALLTVLEGVNAPVARTIGDRLIGLVRQENLDPAVQARAYFSIAEEMVTAIRTAQTQQKLVGEAEWADLDA